MFRPMCSWCGYVAIGRLDFWPNLWICWDCREKALMGLAIHKVPMTAENPLIYDLCNGSSREAILAGRFRYQDEQANWQTETVMRFDLIDDTSQK